MIKHTFSALLFLCSCILLASCNTATPENYFDQAVLNSNMVVGFAGKGPLGEFAYPSARMDEKTGKTVTMSRMEMLNSKIEFVEATLKKVKDLKETPDSKDIVQTSKALYEYILPVYKTDYTELAKLYDASVSQQLIEAKSTAIHEKYGARFEELYNQLIGHGKQYAARHSIKVNWAM